MKSFFEIFSEQSSDKYKIDFETANMLYKLFKDRVVYLDVRSNEEFNSGHINKAINLPVDLINENTRLDKNNLYIIYCRSGRRAILARDKLNIMGYNSVSAGGIINYNGELVK